MTADNLKDLELFADAEGELTAQHRAVGRGGLLPQDDEGVPGSRPGDRR